MPHTNWIPANGGTETPFTTRNGHTLLYMWDQISRHAYYDMTTDLFLTVEEAWNALNFPQFQMDTAAYGGWKVVA